MHLCSFIAFTLLTMPNSQGVKKLIERFSWQLVQYEFDSEAISRAAKESDYFIQGNSIITSLALSGDVLFLATPRLKPGVPSTLNYINIKHADTKSPALKPYPSWEMNDYYNHTGKKKRLTSVINVKVDKCNRLWALDTGVVNELTNKQNENAPAIFIFALSDNTLLRKFSLKDEDIVQASKLKTIVVDDAVGSCEKVFAYIADSSGGLIIYNWEENKSFRIENNYFNFDPLWGNLKTSKGTLVQFREGIHALSLSLPTRNGYRDLLFHPLISTSEFSVPTHIIRNKTLAQQNISAYLHLGERGANMQSPASYMDEELGVLLYTAIVKNSLMCWSSLWGEDLRPTRQGLIDVFNSADDESTPHKISDNSDGVAYPADLTVDVNGTVWVLTNRLLDFIYEKDVTATSFSIYSGTVVYFTAGDSTLLSNHIIWVVGLISIKRFLMMESPKR